MSWPDSKLIVRVVTDDDRDAFGELVQRHQSAVRAFLRQLTRGDAAWADDLAQETFVLAYRNLSRFAGSSAFSTWLLGIAHNQFRNARRRFREAPSAVRTDEIDEHARSPAHTAALQHDLAHALDKLSFDEQTAVHVCYTQGLSHSEAVEVLGWPLGTLKTHLARSKEKLRTHLAVWNPHV